MKALSIRQPWAWAILHAGKDFENRDWYTSFRGRFAIHAAKGMTKSEYQSAISYITQAFVKDTLKTPNTYHLSASRTIVASGELVLPDFEEIVRGAIVGVADLAACISNSPSPWFEGKYGFVLRNVIVLPEPIPCKGALGFWDVPAEIAAQIEAQLKTTAPAARPDERRTA